ncbi:cyclin N-terminal domain-containing protein 2 isoform X2 [Silurus meridionalis]|uniref:cyclin N-terminal domain-containing protein 2 isoform X2 n=1 Tax=Silurus meridionalis TaxID=175797 RepID=UPI001EECAB83|nr:cyclin N-terminal domain-containing protein 2 isoform X2 [Silurus meridionalis]
MARTGLCDSRTLLDRKTEEARVPLRAWANACAVRERGVLGVLGEGDEQKQQHKADNTEHRWVQQLPVFAEDGIIMDFVQQSGSVAPAVEHYEEEAVLNHLHGLQLAPTLSDLVPVLVRREIEVAMSKLGLLFDRSYTWDIFSDMMRSQQHFALSNSELPKPFTESTRAILVDWLIQVHDAFNFSEETLYLAVHLLNRVLRQIKISISSLQLLGVVCLFLAAKKEECLLPEVSELCYLMANTYSKKQLLRMERRVLCALKFDLSHTPPIHFLLLSAYIARCGEKVICMARYLLELSLLEAKCVCFFPVQLAAAALRLARHFIQEPHTPESEAAWCIASTIYLARQHSSQSCTSWPLLQRRLTNKKLGRRLSNFLQRRLYMRVFILH